MSTLPLPAVLTMSEARETLSRLGAALASDAAPEIDASGLQSLDTAAIAVLLDIQRQARAAGKPLRVTGAPPKLGELARLYGVEALLGLA